MKARIQQLTAVLIITLLLVSSNSPYSAQQKQKKQKKKKSSKRKNSAFNGKDLNNWVFYLKDPAVDPAKVFTVQNGVIHIKGDPFRLYAYKGFLFRLQTSC